MNEERTNPPRVDPYRNFNFRVKWDGHLIPGVTRVSGLDRSTAMLENREGNDPTAPKKSPGPTVFGPITLERGLTCDTAFEHWANQIWRHGADTGSDALLDQFRKDISIEICDESGQPVRAFKVYRCWPTVYQPMSALDANGSEVIVERLTLENEGWERDTTVAPPAPTEDKPA